MKTIFVDGYNVINSWGELNSIKDDVSLESSRDRLIEILIEYGEFMNCKIILVFDAHHIPGNTGEIIKLYDKFSIVYTKESETADSFIERYVNKIGRKSEVCVVTSDNLEQQVIFQRGSTRMSSLEFYRDVRKIQGKISKKAEKISTEKKYNRLEDRIDKDTLEKLDKLRKNL